MFDLLLRVLDFAIPVLITIFIGLFGTGFLIEMGLMRRLSGITRPLFKYTNLPDPCASAFLVALGSTVAANSMLVKVKDNGCLDDRQTMLCAMLNSTPAYIREILTYQIPIIIPALGPVVGAFYVMVFILSAFVKVTVVIILSKFWFKESTCNAHDGEDFVRPTIKEGISKALKKQKRMFTRIAIIYLSMTTLVFALRERGVFEAFSVLPLAEVFGIPPESIVPLTTYVASPIIGVSLLGPMIGEGSITNIQAMTVLMLGSMFMLPVFAVRAIIPRYVSIFGPKVGMRIVFFSTGISMLIRFTLLLILLYIA